MQDQPQYPYPQYPPNQPQYPPSLYSPQSEYPTQPQYPYPQYVQPQPASQAKKIPTWAWIGGGVILVAVLLCCSCGFLSMAMNGRTTTASQSNSQQSVVTAPTATPQPAAPTYSYLASDRTGVIFLQWNDASGGQVEGTANLAYIQQGTVETGQANVSGTRSGSVLTLTLSGPNGDLSCHGKFQGTSLRISYTDTNGYVSTFNMRPATEADYNVALQRFYAQNGQ